MPRPAPVSYARRIVAAAVELTGDDPNRAVSIEAILARMQAHRDMEFVGGMAEAVTRGWLKINDGDHKHTVKVGPAWRVDQKRRRSTTKLRVSGRPAGGAGPTKPRKR